MIAFTDSNLKTEFPLAGTTEKKNPNRNCHVNRLLTKVKNRIVEFRNGKFCAEKVRWPVTNTIQIFIYFQMLRVESNTNLEGFTEFEEDILFDDDDPDFDHTTPIHNVPILFRSESN